MFKALIADDEIHMRFLLSETLKTIEDEEIEILTASDGKIALSMIKKHMPDIVFLDVMMPCIDGFEVCSYIKNSMEIKKIYTVLLTAKGQEIDKAMGVKSGADLYITKPFDPDYIIEITRRIISLKNN